MSWFILNLCGVTREVSHNVPDRSLIGMSKSSAGETDALAEVTVLFEVDSESGHHGCHGEHAK
jgi:hypothetical protein